MCVRPSAMAVTSRLVWVITPITCLACWSGQGSSTAIGRPSDAVDIDSGVAASSVQRSTPDSSTDDEETGPSAEGVSVEIGSCPDKRDDGTAKLPSLAAGAIDPDEVVSAIVHLRPVAEVSPDAATQGASLPSRAEQNQQQLRCVSEAFGEDGVQHLARWYEPFDDAALGELQGAMPIGLAFSSTARWSTFVDVATHPYVERISFELGEAARFGEFAGGQVFDCVALQDESATKIAVEQPPVSTERVPVVIELNLDHLPPQRECASSVEVCDEFVASVWARVVAGTRALSCVRDWLNVVLEGIPASVPYAAQDEWPDIARLPPFGQVAIISRAFGVELNWNEMRAASRHPYVRAIWSSSGLSVGELPAGCPPAYDEPVLEPACDQSSEGFDSKLDDDAIALWSAEPTTAFDVHVAVVKNYAVCPRPACPGTANQCAERDRYNLWLEQASRTSQACVRSLIAEIGGDAFDDSFAVGNSFPATLTWEQIQTVAGHPHVVSVSATSSPPPP